jgi:outer membrane biogenesis lipoprotein LolB
LVNQSDEIREIKRYGNRYTVPPESRYVAIKNRQTLSFEWTPEQPGYYTLTAEIDPGADATILSGRSRLTLPVAGKDRPAASGQ